MQVRDVERPTLARRPFSDVNKVATLKAKAKAWFPLAELTVRRGRPGGQVQLDDGFLPS